MLRKLRITLAVVMLAGVTLLFLDFTGAMDPGLGWMARLQLVPAVLAVNVIVLVVLAVLTLLFGRIYCSTVCPLGVVQDGISNVSGRRKGCKSRFRYSKAISWLRYGVLVLFIAALVAGLGIVVSLLDPYAAYGRIARSVFVPLHAWDANSWIVAGAAAVTLTVVAVLAWRGGRTYCNTVCPVGTVLGLLSRFSIFRPAFDKTKCTGCGVCEKGCKSSCIDTSGQTIDLSRCVVCFDCIEKCKFDAMKYRPVYGAKKEASAPEEEKPKKGLSRRNFLSIAALFAVANTVKAQQLQVDGGLAEIEDKKIPDRKTPIAPPGAGGPAHLKQHCTACQLCVSACPSGIMRPSSRLATLMQPELNYEDGYCRPECVECSQVCPSGAIQKITTADKSALSIGHAVFIKENCIVNTEDVQCRGCVNRCPTGAIILVERDPGVRNSLKIPAIDETLCIGCGACEYVCPARPFSAMYVEGNILHHAV